MTLSEDLKTATAPPGWAEPPVADQVVVVFSLDWEVALEVARLAQGETAVLPLIVEPREVAPRARYFAD